MNKKNILVGVICFCAGLVLAWTVSSNKNNRQNSNYKTQEVLVNNSSSNMNHVMEGMTMGLNGRFADEFDKEFLNEMIVHHQGAIDMANLALKNAKHQEIKDLAKNIINAQSSEINLMQEWEKNWYGK